MSSVYKLWKHNSKCDWVETWSAYHLYPSPASPKRFLERARSSSVCVWQIKPFCLAKHRKAAAAFTNTSFVRDGVELHDQHIEITGMLIKPQPPNRHSWLCCRNWSTCWWEASFLKYISCLMVGICHKLHQLFSWTVISPFPNVLKQITPHWLSDPIITDVWGNPFSLKIQQLETVLLIF